MKKNYLLLLLLFILSFTKSFSQDCVILGCADASSQTADGTLPDIVGIPGTCYNSFPYKQIFWQFFYSPTGGDYTQTITPTSVGIPTDMDYVIFDNTIAGTTNLTCPIDITGWTPVLCSSSFQANNAPTGPGIDGTLTTVAGHFYAVAVINWEGVSTGGNVTNTFDLSAPLIDGLPLTAANCPITLPLKLSSFGAKVSNCVTNLDWVAEQATNFKSYEVEYSTDGSKYQKIATLAAAVQSSDVTKKYSYQHSTPGQGNIYYRLKMTDVNGKFEYSKTIALKVNCGRSSTLVYPNPVNDILHINITNSKNTTTANLFDNSGKLIYTEKITNGTNTINMSKFAKGVYILSLKNNETTENIKITR